MIHDKKEINLIEKNISFKFGNTNAQSNTDSETNESKKTSPLLKEKEIKSEYGNTPSFHPQKHEKFEKL